MTDKVEKHSHWIDNQYGFAIGPLRVFRTCDTGHRNQDVHNGNNKEAIIQQYLQL